MMLQISKHPIPPARDPPNRPTLDAMMMAVHTLAGAAGSIQRAVRVGELVSMGILQFAANGDIERGVQVDGKLNKKGGGTLSGGSLVLDYSGDATSVLTVLSPGASGNGIVHVSSPGGEPGLIAFESSGVKRRDLRFSAAGVEVGVSTDGTGPAYQFLFDEAGRFSGTSLHNNASGVAGTTRQYVASGTYTPVLTAIANVDAATATVPWQWTRVGNVVAVSGRLDVDPTAAANTLTRIGASLPIASAFTQNGHCAGSGAVAATPFLPVLIGADATNDRAEIQFSSSVTVSSVALIHFIYQVL